MHSYLDFTRPAILQLSNVRSMVTILQSPHLANINERSITKCFTCIQGYNTCKEGFGYRPVQSHTAVEDNLTQDFWT